MRLLLLCSFILLLCTSGRAQCPANLVINSDQDVADFRSQFPGCARLMGDLTIDGLGQRNITDLSGLSGLTSVGGNLTINDITLTNINGLENVTTISGDFTVSNCRLLSGNGFQEGLAISRIGGFMRLENLPALTDFFPLDDLNILSSGFGSNPISISNLAPLSGLSGSMATLILVDNPNLTDLTALSSLTLIDALTITGNTSLSDCAIAPICASLGAGNTASISGNRGNCANETRVTQQCFPPCTTPDHEALEALYNNTDGDNWTENTNWLSDCDYCDWFGVSCNANGRVVALNLINNNLVGTLPDMFDELVDLVAINLSGSSGLTGPIPASLFELGGITNVVLADNDLTGTIPINVGNAITLEVLQLDNSNSLNGSLPTGLFELSNLERLTLPGCDFGGAIPAAIGDLTALNFLNLANNRFGGNLPPEIGNLTGLTELYLQQNSLRGDLPPELADLTNLTDLLLNNNQFTGCYPTEYSALCSTDRISFANNDGLPDEGSDDFFENTFCATGQNCEAPCHPDFDALIAIYNATGGPNWADNTGWAAGAAGTDCDVCDWEGILCTPEGRVRLLRLENNNLTGTLPPELADLTELEILDLSTNNFQSAPLPDLSSLTGLLLLNCSLCDLTGPFPAWLAQLPELGAISLTGNDLNGPLPDLTGLNLSSLFLAQNEFTGPLPNLGSQPDLLRLSLGNNNFSGQIPASWTPANFPELLQINVVDNQLSGALPTPLGNITTLTNLALRDNDFEGCYPSSFANLCDNSTSFSNNPGLPDGGSDDFFENAFCISGQACENPCPPGDVILNSNQDVTDFKAMYPNCTRISGDLIIDGPNITNTGGNLANITYVAMDFILRNLNGTTVPGITNIDTVGRDFIVRDCPNLGSNGFGNDLDLVHVGRDLTAQDLPSLSTTLPVRNLRSIGRILTFRRTAITSMDGFISLNSIGFGLTLQDNDELTDLAALANNDGNGLTSIGAVSILDNDALTDLTGFSGWAVPGSFTIRDNDLLNDCTAEAVCQKVTENDNLLFVGDNAAGCATLTEIDDACTSLPVTWLAFTATANGKVVDLAWSTTAEEDNAGFTVERSADGRWWADIGQVTPANTEGVHHYTFTDLNPLRATALYRLRQQDLDGRTDYSEVRSVTLKAAPLSVYPNPTSGTFTLATDTPQTVDLYAADGRLLRQIAHTGARTQVPREGLKSGVYWLRFSATGDALKIIIK